MASPHSIHHALLNPQIIHETLPALVELREQGLARHIGITGLPLACFQYILDR